MAFVPGRASSYSHSAGRRRGSAPQLKRIPLGSMLDTMTHSDIPRIRRRRLIICSAVVVLWLVGVGLTVKAGWDPGPWGRRSGEPWSYPLGHVLIEMAKITLVSLGLYHLLRSQAVAISLARTARATGSLLLTLMWIAASSWTDQPGYAYATSAYVFLVTGLLLTAFTVQGVLRVARVVWRRSGGMLPNRRLKLTGADRFNGSGALCPRRGTDYRPPTLAPPGGSPAA